MAGALYVIMLFGVVLIFLGMPITLLAHAIGVGVGALRGKGREESSRSPGRIATEYFLVGLIPSTALASMALGVRTQFPEKVSPLAAGIIVTLAITALMIQSMVTQINEKGNSPLVRLALWSYFFRIVFGVVAGTIAVLYFAPDLLARFGVVLIRIAEWLIDIPVLGWVARIVGGFWILYLGASSITAVFGLMSGLAMARAARE
jgi:hypothetical protein